MKLRMFLTLACVTGVMAGMTASAQAVPIWPSPGFYTGFASGSNAANGFKSVRVVGTSNAWGPICGSLLYVAFDDGSPFADDCDTAIIPSEPGTSDVTFTTTYKFGLSAHTVLDFQTDYSMQNRKDGVVLEQRIDNGAWTDVITAGGSFTVGGYDNTINAAANPLFNRNAWTGDTVTYDHQQVTIGPVPHNGKHYIQFRFRYGSNNAQASQGFVLDEFYILQS